MNIYGDATSADMRKAHRKIVRFALPSGLNSTETGNSGY
jgi:hypothetical protein